jgi:hypothetical protein
VEGPSQLRDFGSQRRHALVEGVDVVDAKRELGAAALVTDGNGAEDPLVTAFEIEGDGFADVEGADGRDLERDGEAVDGEALLLRRRGRGARRQQGEGEGEDGSRDGYAPNETLGTCRSSGRSSSKNACSRNWKKPATRLDGNISIVVFRSRTTALK